MGIERDGRSLSTLTSSAREHGDCGAESVGVCTRRTAENSLQVRLIKD